MHKYDVWILGKHFVVRAKNATNAKRTAARLWNAQTFRPYRESYLMERARVERRTS